MYLNPPYTTTCYLTLFVYTLLKKGLMDALKVRIDALDRLEVFIKHKNLLILIYIFHTHIITEKSLLLEEQTERYITGYR